MPLWIPITVAAAFMQNLRSVLQKHLTGALSVGGATYVRFLYGLPIAALYLWVLLQSSQSALPAPGLSFFIYGLVGGIGQILGTFFLVSLFQYRVFAVGTAYSKTETVQTALIGFAVLGDAITPGAGLAILVSLVGVLFLSLGHSSISFARVLRSFKEKVALTGLACGAAFGVASVSYRAASLSLGMEGFAVPAAITLCYVLAVQTLIMTGWLLWRERGQLAAALRNWKWGALTGLAGALGSIGWFSAMTLENAAYVKALGQIELVFTFAASWFIFKEKSNRQEVTGTLLIVAGLIVLVLTA
ncbi:conserved protein [Tepidicaulis marinus]|uniref:Conserved protein n=1 Tax=Tepidicaulis marinus TaxID=1333998 RepID=A0A081BAL8_9HYPH|nr:EamA family transporter [Tepidicaulis marinus]GAK45086.1 conserved protein [Tepidicaulis marinus]